MLLISGAQTPSDLLGNAIRLALDHPAQAVEPGFVTEVLRYDPPIHALTRVVGREAEIAGVTVRPGSRVFVLLAAANRDRRRFAGSPAPASSTSPGNATSRSRSDSVRTTAWERGSRRCRPRSRSKCCCGVFLACGG
jgi:hypothetical protein